MKKSKRFILLILTISLMLAIVSCGDSKDKDETIINNLFDDVYYKIVHDKIIEREKVSSLLDESGYMIEKADGLDAYKVIDESIPEDYVYLVFGYEESKKEEYLGSISYYDGNKDLEVSFSNYNSDKNEESYEYFTHIIGQDKEKVKNISEQIEFLNKAVNKVAEKEKDNRLDDPIEIELDLNYEVIDGNLVAYIETNLPDGIDGIVSLKNDEIDYVGQNSITIESGKAKTETFSNMGQDLEAGEYILEVTFPIANVLEDDVYEKVGKEYANYIGDEKIEDETGTIIKKNIKVNLE